MKKENYEKWVEEAYQYIEKVYPQVCQLEHVNVGSTQYIPKLGGDIEFVFLGHDAHEGIEDANEKMDITNAKERFYIGNGDPRCWRNDPKWKIWNNIEKAFRNIGFNEIMENGYISERILNKTIVTNALLFNYSGQAKELNDKLKPHIINECMSLTGKLIFDVIKPKMVICSSCSLVFEPLILNYKKNNNADIHYDVLRLNGTKKKVMKCVYDGITVLGIPHTSYPVPLSVASFVRDMYLGKEISNTISNIATQSNGLELYRFSINPTHIIDLVTSSKDFHLIRGNTPESYILSDNLMLTITRKNKGYLAIRHKNYDNKCHYPNPKYELTDSYRDFLKEIEWDCDSPVWVATKKFKQYGNDDNTIATNIVSEINDIVKLLE
jgi:hypothetical protein